jgi:hypothetical protein
LDVRGRFDRLLRSGSFCLLIPANSAAFVILDSRPSRTPSSLHPTDNFLHIDFSPSKLYYTTYHFLMWCRRVQIPAARRFQCPRASASSFTRGRATPTRGPRNSIRRPPPIRNDATPSDTQIGNTGSPVPNYDPAQNTLLSPVYIPEDPHGVLKESHPATGILANSGLVVQRQLELMNVMM